MTERRMPIQLSGAMDLRRRRGERVCIVQNLPWEIFAQSERQCQANHSGQSLEVIAARGGFGAGEALAVICNVPWERFSTIDEELAHRLLYSMHVAFNGGKRISEAKITELEAVRDHLRQVAGVGPP